jgi:ACS family tartrate transporter-like MFS transporter
VIYYLTCWFPANVRGRAISRFYIAWPLSNTVMGAVAGTLLGLHGRLGLAGWQWLFLVEGFPAVLMGLLILSLLPDSPRVAKWLSPEERSWIEQQLAMDLTSGSRQKEQGILRALMNPFVLAFAFVNMIVLGSYYAFNLSAPQILGEDTHLNIAAVGYVVAVGGLLGAAAMLFAGWHSDYRGERFLHLAIPLLTSAAAYGVLGLTSEPPFVIGAYCLAIVSNMAIAATFWLAPSEVLGVRSMAVGVAAINSIGQLGSFISPYLWGIAKDATGGFRLGISLLPIGYTLAALTVFWVGRHTMASEAANIQTVNEIA